MINTICIALVVTRVTVFVINAPVLQDLHQRAGVGRGANQAISGQRARNNSD